MLPFNDSLTSELGDQNAYRDLMLHLRQFFSEETLTERLNVEQMFILVDGVLPIEACLYYQVLPLFLDGSRLHLGMVNPSDTNAADYVRRIVSYLNYSLITRKISSQALQAALSAYLKYSGNQSSSKQQSVDPDDSLPFRSHPSQSGITHNLETNKETLVLEAVEELGADDTSVNSGQASTMSENGPLVLPADELTCIDPEDTEIISLENGSLDHSRLDNDGNDSRSPDRSEAGSLLDAVPAPTASNTDTPDPAVETTPTTSEADTPTSSSSQHSQGNADQSSYGLKPPISTSAVTQPDTNSFSTSGETKEPLAVKLDPHRVEESIEDIKALRPRALLRELLARAMSGGIGRLYFERKQDYGRILWSQSGVLQSVVDDIPSVKLQALVNELKRLTHLPLLPLQHTKQIELERIYNHQRVLLRFRFIPGEYGEQVTLQVLRGAALSFYQQQQVKRIGQDALSIAKQLQLKVNELRSRLEAHPRLSTSGQTSLPELKQMLSVLEEQIDSLQPQLTDSSSP